MPSTTSKESKQTKTCCEGQMQEWFDYAERCARQEPLKCTLIAFLGGLLLTILPVGRIVGVLTRLVIALIRPALVVLGAMKVFEEIEKRRDPKQQ